MAKDPSLHRLTLYYTAGNLTSRAIKFALFFLYTFFLTKPDLGFFDLTTNTITLITPVLAFQLYDSILRWTISNNKNLALQQVVSSTGIVVLINLFLFTVLYVIVIYFVNLRYPVLIYLTVILQTFYPVILQFARGSGKNAIYALSGVLFTVVFAAATIVVLVVLKLKVEGLLIANVIALAATIAYLIVKLNYAAYFSFRFFNRKLAKEMLLYSLPLIPNTLSWWAISTADRYIILAYLGIASNGLFAVATKFPSIMLMVHSIFNMAWQEKAIRTYSSENRDEYYSFVLDRYFTFFFTAIIIAIAVTKPLFRIVIESSYYDAWKLMPFMYMAIGFQALSSFYGSGYLSSKDTKGALTTTIFGVIVSISLNFILIPFLGLTGSSISFLAGFFIMFTARVFQTRKYFHIRFPFKRMLIIMTIAVIVSLITLTENIYIMFLNIAGALVVFGIFNRHSITAYLSKIKLYRKEKFDVANF